MRARHSNKFFAMPVHTQASGDLYWRAIGEGETVLLIHGLGSSGADWAFQVPPLIARHRVLLVDLPGSGLSPMPPEALSIAAMATRIGHLLDDLALDRLHVVGFSLGGAVALELALQRPNLIQRLILINSLPSYRVDHWKKWLELYLQIGVVRLFGLPRAARMVAARLFPEPHQAAMRERVATVVGGRDVEPYLATARALAAWCAADRLPALRAQTLLIAGEFDYTPLAEKRVWAQRMGAQLALVRGSRHGTPFDATLACNRLILGFLGGETVADGQLWRADDASEAPVEAPIDLDEPVAS